MAHLPKRFRPDNTRTREFRPGFDLPAWFYRHVKSIDPNVYFVWHPYRLTYDDVMTQYTGSLENPRFNIHKREGQEIWGWVLDNSDNDPIPENRWHLWRLCDPGWCHVINIESKDPDHLKTLLDRFHLRAQLADKGPGAVWKHMEQEEEDKMVKAQEAQTERFADIQNENKKFFKEAAENFERGHAAPTRPQKETIHSYPGQKRFSRLTRDLEDKEGGLYVPED